MSENLQPPPKPNQGMIEIVLDAPMGFGEHQFNEQSFIAMQVVHPRHGNLTFGLSEKTLAFIRDFLVKRSTLSS